MNNSHLITGVNGEDVICKHLVAKKHKIIARNVLYKCGELDLVSMKEGILHFIEVKTARVIRETSVLSVLPEENLHFGKIMRLKRAIQLFMAKHKMDQESTLWQFDLYAVVIHETLQKITIYPYLDLIL